MIFEDIAAHGVVPVIALDDAAAALPLADALIAGGLPVAEITFRTAAARDTIAAIAAHRPEVLIGAGTVLVEDQVDAALAAGALFALSPGLDAAVLDVNLPGGPTLPLGAWLAARGVPVVYVTGLERVPGREGAVVLRKPVRPEALLAALGRAMRPAG